MSVRQPANANGAAVLAYLLARRPPGAAAWTVPMWGSPLSAGIMPLGVTAEDRLFPLGTAFTISRLGVVASALHNIHEALTYRRDGDAVRRRPLPTSSTLDDVGLTVLHSHVRGGAQIDFTLWPLESVNGAPPTDLVFGFPVAAPGVPMLALPLSFAVPRVGATIYALGYGRMHFPEGGIALDDLRGGSRNWVDRTNFDLRVVAGRVSRVFTQRFAAGFVEGPCVLIDGDVDHGQSGGPVLTEDGFVCGVVSAGASSFTPGPSSVVSLLYPTLLTEIAFGFSAGPVRITARHPLLERVAHGDVVTDGSESLVHLYQDGGAWTVGPAVHRDDQAYVHDDLAGYLGGRSASTLDAPTYRVRMSDAAPDR